VRVDDRGPYDFILDTGASHLIVDPALAAELGLALGDTRDYGAAGGSGLVSVAETRLAKIEVGTIVQRDTTAGIMGLTPIGTLVGAQISGILGHSFLAEFVVTIDCPRRQLRLDSPAKPT
jgi:predicted aspartyl protease